MVGSLVIVGWRAAPPTAAQAGSCGRGPALADTAVTENLDDPAASWGVFCDGPASHPLFSLRAVRSPSQDGHALECSYRGGTPYAGVHCYRQLLPRARVRQMNLALAFRFSTTSCNNAGSASSIQALEFSVSRWSGTQRAELAAQYEIVGDGAPTWRIWDGSGWTAVTGPVGSCLISNRWHRLGLAGRIVDAGVRYDALTIDGARVPLTRTFAPVRAVTKAKLAVAVQADGNANGTPYRFWIDRVRLGLR